MFNSSKPRYQRILDALNIVVRDNFMVYVRPDGEIAGLCPPDSELSYTDPKLNIKRSRMKFWDLDGTKDLEEKHAWSNKRTERVDIVPIEKSGGVALTTLMPDGDRQPVYTATQAERLNNKVGDLKAKLQEMNRIEREYKQKDENYRKLQTKIGNLKEEKKELEEQNEDLRASYEQLNKENEMLRARNTAMLSWRRTLQSEIEAMEDRQGDIVNNLKKIWNEAEEARLNKMDASGFDANINRKEYSIEESPSEELEETERQMEKGAEVAE